MSARPSGIFSNSTSGDMYAGVPAIVLARSIVELWSARGMCLATPKSRIFTCPVLVSIIQEKILPILEGQTGFVDEVVLISDTEPDQILLEVATRKQPMLDGFGGQLLKNGAGPEYLLAHLDQRLERNSPASLAFENVHGREPKAGDLLSFEEVARD